MYPYEAPMFSLRGMHQARVVGVHDGDTLKCIIKLQDEFYTFNVRLDGIDTPEMTSKTPEIKDMAIKARNRLIELITGKPFTSTTTSKKEIDAYFKQNYTSVTLECIEMDKYGRVLAKINDYAEILLNEGLARRYSGKTKDAFE